MGSARNTAQPPRDGVPGRFGSTSPQISEIFWQQEKQCRRYAEEKDGGSKNQFPEPQVIPFLPDPAQEENDSVREGHHITGADIARVLSLDKSRVGVFSRRTPCAQSSRLYSGSLKGVQLLVWFPGATRSLGNPGFKRRFELGRKPACNSIGADGLTQLLRVQPR